MDGVGTEAPGVLVSEILEDEPRQVGNVGTTQSADEMPKLDLVQFVGIEFIQAPILHALQVLVPSEGQIEVTLE